MIIKRDEFYTREWESHYEKPSFDDDQEKFNPQIHVKQPPTPQSEFATEELTGIPFTSQESLSEAFLQTGGIQVGTDTDLDTNPLTETNWQHTNLKSTYPVVQKMI